MIFTALHAMHVLRSSHNKAICPSVKRRRSAGAKRFPQWST